eukprot:TRINITY_DN10110_c0_g1_i1.p1 TRINITY_DN10110_c0_g1~~TRINITY_DN10110_c0_g1_i1.p1  ORF type:complete len:297 (+),score=29.77 TRINITY_DN10110_c0_g1_i1:31-891(+)
MSESKIKEYLLAGGGAAIVSRTVIAPIERVKIIFQTSPEANGYMGIFKRIMKGEGVLSFWKGNGVAVVRVVPYLSVQLASNDKYKEYMQDVIKEKHIRSAVCGGLAGPTSILTTYPLDTVRARLAVQMNDAGVLKKDTLMSMTQKIIKTEGYRAMYRGCYMSCIGGGSYAAIKFSTYDYLKNACLHAFNHENDSHLTIFQRAISGAVGGFVAQTLIYPTDVLRRRMQTYQGSTPPYRGIIHGLTTIAREEGIRTGLFRGLSLNYLKTVPNVALYLSLYDVFKYYLL